jgi:hypothetical protein
MRRSKSAFCPRIPRRRRISELKLVRDNASSADHVVAHQLIKRDSVAAPPGGKRDG